MNDVSTTEEPPVNLEEVNDFINTLSTREVKRFQRIWDGECIEGNPLFDEFYTRYITFLKQQEEQKQQTIDFWNLPCLNQSI